MCKAILSIREYVRFDKYSNIVPWKIKLKILIDEPNTWEHSNKDI
jgi:hypothetical protein